MRHCAVGCQRPESSILRDERAGFTRLKNARDATLNVNRWHHFMGALRLLVTDRTA
jgi:hypothetical protein